jgi:hypothetical protein
MADFDSKALELARDAQGRIENASPDRMRRGRQTSIIQCAIIEGMKWAAPRQPWPAGCIKKSSCARNRTCAYGCHHQSRDIGEEVDAAMIAASPHPIVAEGVETGAAVEAIARSDAKYDGRDFDGLSREAKLRYLDRAAHGFAAIQGLPR